MTYAIVFRPEAVAEARVAQQWYEEQKSGLGERFVDAIDETIQRVASNPLAFSLIHGEARRAVVRRFPYGVYFRVDASSVVVIAVMHSSRHPRRWQARR